jgi:antirestriction protein ArdC
MATNNARKNKALDTFADLMIEKMQAVSKDWEKPWIAHVQGRPMNAITGRPYNGLNDLMLFFHTEKHGYKVPAYLTFKQATELGSYAKKGEKGFPVAYWGRYYYEKDNPEHHIKPEEYNKLSKEEKELYKQRFILQEYIVFNVQQTTIPEEKPDVWEKIQAKFDTPKLNDENGMFKSIGVDNMLKNKSWLCPIHVQESNRAFYRPMTDEITIPLKAQFKDGESFYSTLFHEMGHSTGAESRLNREHGNFFGDEKYAKEELVAELTAALSSANLGIATSIREENAQYLNSWLETLQQEPKFILSVLSDVHKASEMINTVVEQEVAKVKETEDVNVTKGKEQAQQPDINIVTDYTLEFSDKENVKNVLNLEVGKSYMYGGKEVQLTNFTRAGSFTFKYPESGKTFTLLAKDGDVYINLSRDQITKLNADNNVKKTMFTENEIPKDDLKKIGVQLKNLSATDLKNLLNGKNTKELNIKHPVTGNKISGQISLLRDEDTGKVSVITKVAEQQQKKAGLKM